MNSRILLAVLASIHFLGCNFAEARWAKKDEYSSVFESYQRELFVKKDGSYSDTTTWVRKINNDAGKKAGNLRLIFNSANSKMEILDAKVINSNSEIAVPKRHIEEKSVPANITGTDKLKQLVVNFQDVQVGSTLHLVNKLEKITPDIPQFFRFGFFPASFDYIEKLEIKITSEVPLYFEKMDQQNLLSITESLEKDKFIYTLINTSPLSFDIVEEKDPFLSPNDSTYALFSSAKSFEEIGRLITPSIEEKYNGAPNMALNNAISEAQMLEDPVDQINFITNWIIPDFRYLKDYQKDTSGFVPRDLDEILQTRFGDCKDFSLITSYALRKLGYKAYTAWIYRGYSDSVLSDKIAFDRFNHAIVWAEKNGRQFWIDPTNRVSYAQGIFTDIEGRGSLVLDPANPGLRKTTALEAEKNILELHAEKNLAAQISNSKFQYRYLGNAAINITGSENHRTIQELKYRLAAANSEERNILSSEIKTSDLKILTVSDAQVELSVREKLQPLKSSAGLALRLPMDGRIDQILGINSKDRVSGLNLGPHSATKRYLTYKGMQVIGKLPQNCSIQTPWLTASRKLKKHGHSIIVEDTSSNLKKFFSAADVQSKEFQVLQEKLSDCFQNILLVYKKVGTK